MTATAITGILIGFGAIIGSLITFACVAWWSSGKVIVTCPNCNEEFEIE